MGVLVLAAGPKSGSKPRGRRTKSAYFNNKTKQEESTWVEIEPVRNSRLQLTTETKTDKHASMEDMAAATSVPDD